MSDLRELYQEVILDHSKNPRNFRLMEKANRKAEGYNPLCGDRITVYLQTDGEVIRDITFQGGGCAISKASTSLMTAFLKGKTKAEALDYFSEFHKMLTPKEQKFDPQKIGKLSVLAGVSEFPVRVKCATLAWHTLKAALEGKQEQVSTEAFSTEWTAG